MRLLNKSLTESIYSSLKEELDIENKANESVMINTGSTTITSDETGVTVEDNGNTITTGNGVTVDVDNTDDLLPAETDIPIEEPIDTDVPEEDLEVPEEPVEELPEEPIEEPNDDLEESLKEGVYLKALSRALNNGDLDEDILIQNYNDYGYNCTSASEILSNMDDSEAKRFMDDCGWSDLYSDLVDDEDLDESIEEDKNDNLDEAIDKDGGPFPYLMKHGQGPGTLPADVEIVKYGESSNDKDIVYLNKVLTTEEEDKYDMKPMEKLEDCDTKPIQEADGYNQNQNVEIYQNPEFDYQILDITELDNVDSGDIRAIDMANILNNLDESLTEHFGTENWGELNSFLTRKGTHKKTNESYSSAILELILPRLNESIGEFKNVYMLEVYGDKALKECVVRDSKSHIITEYSGKSKNPVKHFEGVILDIMNKRTLKEEIRDEAYIVAEAIAKQYDGQGTITWDDFRDALEEYTRDVNPDLLSDENLWNFELEVRDVLSWQYGWATIYEGENEGGLTTEYGDDNQDTEDQNRDNITNESAKLYSTIYYLSGDESEEEVADYINILKKDFPDANVQFKPIKSDGIPAVEIIGTRDDVVKFCYDFEPLNPKELGMSDEEANKMITPYNGDVLESVEIMVNEPMKDKGVNFADSKAITKDEERQENHLKQHKDKNKESKNFKVEKEPDQENTTGKTEEELTDTTKVDKLPKAKKTKVNAEKLKVKEIKEDVSIRGVDDEGNDYSYDKKITKPYYVQIIFHNTGDQRSIKEFDSVEEAKRWVEENKNTSKYDYSIYSSSDNELIDYITESAKLKEADELLDEPEIMDGSDMRDGREDIEESGSDVAIFHRKPASVDAMRAAEQNGITVNKSNYKVVGTKELSGDEFNNFANHLSSGSYDWLKEYNDTSNSGEFKCVEVVNSDDDSYTILVDPQGYDYARYAAIKDNLSNEEELIEPEEELIEPETEE